MESNSTRRTEAMKLKVKVTQKNIDEGKPGHDSACAIALAIEEAMPGYLVSVLPLDNVFFYKKGSDGLKFTAEVPLVAEEFAATYDGHGPAWVKPVEFELNLVPAENYLKTV